MPDVWTHHPQIVRDLLQEGGFSCGVQPRILKGRDPEWTCIVDGKRIAGDIYVHEADTMLSAGIAALGFGLLGALLLIALYEAWVIIRLKRAPSGSPSAKA
ncbi:MAG TPA: hypothetical protein VFI54_17775 [Solirubrobacteraceae bacterium]|nr:hypothetical protein [Solirubrobacteraceae bacterium]